MRGERHLELIGPHVSASRMRIELDSSRDEDRVCEEMRSVLDSLGQRSIY